MSELLQGMSSPSPEVISPRVIVAELLRDASGDLVVKVFALGDTLVVGLVLLLLCSTLFPFPSPLSCPSSSYLPHYVCVLPSSLLLRGDAVGGAGDLVRGLPLLEVLEVL